VTELILSSIILKKGMGKMRFEYCVFTVMTPDLGLEEAASTLGSLGYKGVEWRVTEVPKEPPATVDFWRGNRATVDASKVLEKAPEVKALSDKYGLAIPALGTYVTAKELEEVQKFMEAAKIMGCPQIRVGVPGYNGSINYNELFDEALEDYGKVEALAKEYRVKANIEIHMGNICPSASAARRFLSNFNPKHVGAIYDPGNMVHEGYENWQMGLEILGPYLAHVHVKNSRWEIVSEEDGVKRWRATMCGIKEGQVYWGDVLAALRKVGYNGWLSFEDFSKGETKVKLKENIHYLKVLEKKL